MSNGIYHLPAPCWGYAYMYLETSTTTEVFKYSMFLTVLTYVKKPHSPSQSGRPSRIKDLSSFGGQDSVRMLCKYIWFPTPSSIVGLYLPPRSGIVAVGCSCGVSTCVANKNGCEKKPLVILTDSS